MNHHPLKIVSVDQNKNPEGTSASGLSTRKLQRQKAQAYYDRLWLVDPDKMNPLRNCMEIERMKRTEEIMHGYIDLKDKLAVDLGCGAGFLTRRWRDLGASLVAVDISANALKILNENEMRGIEPKQDYVPMTSLPDDTYDLVISTELIAALPEEEYRLYFSELARLVKPDGFVICSTPVDINSDDALQRFGSLAETEFQIEKWIFSYHLCCIRLKDFFKAPSRFVRASRDSEYRHRQLDRRVSISQWWFRLNSHRTTALFWTLVQYPCKPFVYLLEKNRSLMIALEKFCHFLWSDSGISHAIFIGKRRSMLNVLPADEIPKERKHKKQVWE